jgi:type IV secretion system protein VirD4
MDRHDDAVFNLIVLAVAGLLCAYLRGRRRVSGTAFGTASWATDRLLRKWGMLGRKGLILGRTVSGKLIRVPRYTHVLLIGGTGSGKGIGLILPNLLDYYRGSIVAFDPKGDLHATARGRRKGKLIRLAPFSGGDHWNVLDTIPVNSPLLTDHARAMAAALVVRPPEGAREPHWEDKAEQVIAAILVFVLRGLSGRDRSMGSVQEIASDPAVLLVAAERLRGMGGVAARMGSQVKALFDNDGLLTKEGASVVSVVTRHLGWLDSEAVMSSVADSTWDVRDLLRPGTTLFLQIPQSQLEAQKGLLRLWVSTLVRLLGAEGDERTNEVLFLLDEAGALGPNLAAVEEALVRGRSAGVRMLLAFQSDAQVTAAFPNKQTLLYDNATTQIYVGGATGYESAERLSKSLGNWTQAVESFGDESGFSRGTGPEAHAQVSRGRSASVAPQARALLFPDELLRLPERCVIGFVKGLPSPVMARRVEWFSDPLFNPKARLTRRAGRACVVALCAVGVAAGLEKWVVGGLRTNGGGAAGEVKRGEDRRGARGGDGPARPQGAEERGEPRPGVGRGRGAGPVRHGDAGGDQRPAR